MPSGASAIAVVYSTATMNYPRFGLLLPLILLGTAVAQDRVAAALDSLPSIKRIDQVVISPDGAQVAYIIDGQLSVASLASGATHSIGSSTTMTAREATWSADSHPIAW